MTDATPSHDAVRKSIVHDVEIAMEDLGLSAPQAAIRVVEDSDYVEPEDEREVIDAVINEIRS